MKYAALAAKLKIPAHGIQTYLFQENQLSVVLVCGANQ